MKKQISPFKVVIIVAIFPLISLANMDIDLNAYVKQFRLKPLKRVENTEIVKYELGKKLFFDKSLSGEKNISCASCHKTDMGSGDGLPLGLGEGAIDSKLRVATNVNQILSRNTQPLFNLKDSFLLFWDGRVEFDGFEFKTPESGLNGEYPSLNYITKELKSALAAQALFPLVDKKEMKGSSPRFSKLSNEAYWKVLTDRISQNKDYISLISKAFENPKEFNIGHIANAIAYFQGVEFQATNTPWDNYLRGEKSALSLDEKKGAIVFFTKGKCIKCHKGSHLGGNNFQNIAAPQIGPGKDLRNNDEGRFLITKREEDLYKFKVPPLRNISLSAPYFHSGAYKSLADVITHYATGAKSLDIYNDDWLISYEQNHYNDRIYVERNSYMLFRKKEGAHTLLRAHEIRLNKEERAMLLKFLDRGLTSI